MIFDDELDRRLRARHDANLPGETWKSAASDRLSARLSAMPSTPTARQNLRRATFGRLAFVGLCAGCAFVFLRPTARITGASPPASPARSARRDAVPIARNLAERAAVPVAANVEKAIVDDAKSAGDEPARRIVRSRRAHRAARVPSPAVTRTTSPAAPISEAIDPDLSVGRLALIGDEPRVTVVCDRTDVAEPEPTIVIVVTDDFEPAPLETDPPSVEKTHSLEESR